jgi:RNA polymerase sigma-70 factor, ECF subfamily
MSESEPKALLAALASGREDAFAALYTQYGERLFRAALVMLRRPHDAEDAVQEVFMGLVRTRQSLPNVQDLTAYLFSALRHAAGKIATRRGPEMATEVVLEELAERTSPPAETPLGDHLTWALESLPPDQREMIALKFDGELTFAQIATVLGINPSTAASRYRYALDRLRRMLTDASAAGADARPEETCRTR